MDVPLYDSLDGQVALVTMSSGLGAITEAQSGGTPAYRISKTV